MSSFNSLATVHYVIKQYPTEDVSPLACLRRIREDGISEAFLNVDRLQTSNFYLTLAVATTEGERSFSVLKRVKQSAAFSNFPRLAM